MSSSPVARTYPATAVAASTRWTRMIRGWPSAIARWATSTTGPSGQPPPRVPPTTSPSCEIRILNPTFARVEPIVFVTVATAKGSRRAARSERLEANSGARTDVSNGGRGYLDFASSPASFRGRPLRNHGGVVPLERVERDDPQDVQPRADKACPHLAVDGGGVPRDVDAAGLDHQHDGPVGREEPKVPLEYLHLIPLRDILIQKVDAADGARVPVGLRRVGQDRQDVVPPLGEGEEFLEHPPRDLDRIHNPLRAQVRDVAHRRSARGAEVEDPGTLLQGQDLPPLDEQGGELAPPWVPQPILRPTRSDEPLTVHGGAGHEVLRVQRPPVGEHAGDS